MKGKNTLRYILAIPLAIVASMILPKWFMFIFNIFIPFDFINQFIETYLLSVFAGWITVGVTFLIAPKRKILFALIQLTLNLIAIIYMFKIGGDFNYLFLIGTLLCLLMFSFKFIEDKKLEAEKK